MTITDRLMSASSLTPRLFVRARHQAAIVARAAPAGTALTAGGKHLTSGCDPRTCIGDCRCFAHVNDIESINRELWFSQTPARPSPDPRGDHQPPDERTLKLGKTVRTLHERLPTLLQSPLPADILSPQISLHLFPSTHPHLPTVSGRIAYNAALWTAPVAWGRVPLVGNVKLTILSERMLRNGGASVPIASRDEKLIVKWKTCGKTKHRDGTGGIYRGIGIGARDPVDKIKEFIAGTRDEASSSSSSSQDGTQDDAEFCGIFVFDFDEQGRIVKHVIEHTEEGGHWDRSMTRVVSVTDWLLGRFHGKNREQMPELALCEERPRGNETRLIDRRERSRD